MSSIDIVNCIYVNYCKDVLRCLYVESHYLNRIHFIIMHIKMSYPIKHHILYPHMYLLYFIITINCVKNFVDFVF